MSDELVYVTVTAAGLPLRVRRRNTGFVVYLGGWRVATFKTRRGAIARAEKILREEASLRIT